LGIAWNHSHPEGDGGVADHQWAIKGVDELKSTNSRV
jgi:hypothetical protein